MTCSSHVSYLIFIRGGRSKSVQTKVDLTGREYKTITHFLHCDIKSQLDSAMIPNL
jgi:hypothetical protein